MTTAMMSATAGSSQYEPALARMIGRRRNACRRGSVGDGIEQDRGDGQVAPLGVIVVCIGSEHEGAGGHGQRGHAAHDEHGQAVYLWGAREEPFGGGGDDEHFEDQQRSAVDERGNVVGLGRVRPTGRADKRMASSATATPAASRR